VSESLTTPGGKTDPPSMGNDLSRLRINRSEAGESAGGVPSSWAKPGIWSGNVGALRAAGVLALIVVGFLLGRASVARGPQVDAVQPGPALTASQPLAANQPPKGLSASGYVVAQRQAAVASQATGRLKELRVEAGDRVKKDDVIGVIENEGLQAAVRQEEANVLSAQARISSAGAGLAEVSLQRKRIFDLFERKSVSQAERDTVIATFDRARAELASAEANLGVARARLDRAKVDLSYSFILAPFDGTVISKNADEGEVVAPFGSSANARAAVVTIADMSSLEVEADVSESNLQRVSVGQGCGITLDSIPGQIYEGIVSNIVPTVDRAKATVLVKIKFNNLDDRVIPEMSARVTFRE